MEWVGMKCRYGPVFRSHLVGVPSIIVTTPEMARFVYAERSRFRASYPSNIATLVGKKSLSNCDPARHPFLKKIVHNAFFPETLRHEVGRLEDFVLDTLNSWNDRTVQTAAEMKEVGFVSELESMHSLDSIIHCIRCIHSLFVVGQGNRV